MDITAFGKTLPLDQHLWDLVTNHQERLGQDTVNLIRAAYCTIQCQNTWLAQGDARHAQLNAKLDQLLSRVAQPRWLVQGTVSVSHYMQDGREQRVETLVVLADSEQEARDKFVAYWESKTSEYATYYSAWADKAYQTS
jgi:hypothetical protein